MGAGMICEESKWFSINHGCYALQGREHEATPSVSSVVTNSRSRPERLLNTAEYTGQVLYHN